MTITEVNKFLKSSAASEVKDLQFGLSFTIANFETTFALNTLYSYVTDQLKGWDSFESLPVELLVSRNYFATLKERIEQLVEDVKAGQPATHYIAELNIAIGRRNDQVIPADSSIASFLLSISKESSQLFSAAYAFFFGSINYSLFSNKEYLQGIIMALMFKLADNPTLNRTTHEKSSFNALKNRVEKYVSQSDEFLKELYRENQQQSNESIEKLEAMTKENQIKLDKWFALNKSIAEKFTQEVNEERKNIERTYKELLQLQAPAKHWKDTSEKLTNEGHMFMRALFALIIVGGISLYLLLWKTPEGMIESFFNSDKTSAVRWSIIFITFISLFFIGIQSLRKAMFSSFHLARDAQEREKLTMYYLSLIKEGAIGDDDKTLILQSLFSRADSGLLKEDSSPTMPGIIEKLRGQ